MRTKAVQRPLPIHTPPTRHEFRLELNRPDALEGHLLDRLFEAGCDDATPAKQNGRVFLSFTRKGPTLREAVLSAVCDVRRAGFGLDVLRVDDLALVNQVDIGRALGISKQAVNRLVGARGPQDFPRPVSGADGGRAWHWVDVATWAVQKGRLAPEKATDARDIELINTALAFHQLREVDSTSYTEIASVILFGRQVRRPS